MTYRVFSRAPYAKPGAWRDQVHPYQGFWLAYDAVGDKVYGTPWYMGSLDVTAWGFANGTKPGVIRMTPSASAYPQEFPVSPLSGYNNTLTNFMYGNGSYVVTRSRELLSREAYKAFDYAYSGGSTVWQVSSIANENTVGDWVQLQLPFSIKLYGFRVFFGNTATIYARSPNGFDIHGIQGDGAMELLGSFVKVWDWSDFYIAAPGNAKLYNKFRFTINGQTSLASLNEIRFFGTW